MVNFSCLCEYKFVVSRQKFNKYMYKYIVKFYTDPRFKKLNVSTHFTRSLYMCISIDIVYLHFFLSESELSDVFIQFYTRRRGYTIFCAFILFKYIYLIHLSIFSYLEKKNVYRCK